jgi:dimethylhistidine N-methyltransferase
MPEALDAAVEQFRQDVFDGLSKSQKELPCKYLYDARGSELFDQICELPEYYPTRTEMEIMNHHAPAMAEAIGPGAVIIEFGSGSSAKIPMLLDHLESPAAYVPVEVCQEHLDMACERLAESYPDLNIQSVCADFTQPFDVPDIEGSVSRRVGYFPGSTIGNFSRAKAKRLLNMIARMVGPGGGLLIGFDLKKSPSVLKKAYNDAQGVTAEFNLNVLSRINNELDADFSLDDFEHQAIYEDSLTRIEMHIVSMKPQTVTIGEQEFDFKEGETIHTESSHKYTQETFSELIATAGFRTEQCWTDEAERFAVMYAVAV